MGRQCPKWHLREKLSVWLKVDLSFLGLVDSLVLMSVQPLLMQFVVDEEQPSFVGSRLTPDILKRLQYVMLHVSLCTCAHFDICVCARVFR